MSEGWFAAGMFVLGVTAGLLYGDASLSTVGMFLVLAFIIGEAGRWRQRRIDQADKSGADE